MLKAYSQRHNVKQEYQSPYELLGDSRLNVGVMIRSESEYYDFGT